MTGDFAKAGAALGKCCRRLSREVRQALGHHRAADSLGGRLRLFDCGGEEPAYGGGQTVIQPRRVGDPCRVAHGEGRGVRVGVSRRS